MAQLEDNTLETAKNTAGCWTGGPGYSTSKMSSRGKLLTAPADWNKPLNFVIVGLQDWEVSTPEADPKGM